MGVFYSQTGQRQRRFWKMRRGTGKKEYRVNGNRNASFSEVLEQVRGNVDMGCSAQIMRKSFISIRDDSWEEFIKGCREEENPSEWTLEKLREA